MFFLPCLQSSLPPVNGSFCTYPANGRKGLDYGLWQFRGFQHSNFFEQRRGLQVAIENIGRTQSTAAGRSLAPRLGPLSQDIYQRPQ